MYSSGRCYQCLPDAHWDNAFGLLKGTGTNDQTGKTECHIISVSQPVFTKSGYAVVEPGYPPIPPFDIFDTFENAAIFAKKNFDVSSVLKTKE